MTAAIVGGLLASCGDGGGGAATQAGGGAPTAYVGQDLDIAAVSKSPTLDISAYRPMLISTPGAALVGSGLDPNGRPNRVVHILDRQSNAWRELPPLPADTFMQSGFEVADVPYFVGAPCRNVEKTEEFDALENCRGAVVYRLVDNASRWEMLTPPNEVFPGEGDLAGAGPVGSDAVALVPNGPPYLGGIAVLDVTRGDWQEIPFPENSNDEYLVPCFTRGILHLRTLTWKPDTPHASTDPPEQYAFRAWALDGSLWAGPANVDLGTIVPSGGGSQLCTGGQFLATNESAGGRGVSLRLQDSALEQVSLTVPPLGRFTTLAPARASVMEDGAAISLDLAGNFRTAPNLVEPTDGYLDSAEAGEVIDLLTGDEMDRQFGSEQSDRLTVTTFKRS